MAVGQSPAGSARRSRKQAQWRWFRADSHARRSDVLDAFHLQWRSILRPTTTTTFLLVTISFLTLTALLHSILSDCENQRGRFFSCAIVQRRRFDFRSSEGQQQQQQQQQQRHDQQQCEQELAALRRWWQQEGSAHVSAASTTGSHAHLSESLRLLEQQQQQQQHQHQQEGGLSFIWSSDSDSRQQRPSLLSRSGAHGGRTAHTRLSAQSAEGRRHEGGQADASRHLSNPAILSSSVSSASFAAAGAAAAGAASRSLLSVSEEASRSGSTRESSSSSTISSGSSSSSRALPLHVRRSLLSRSLLSLNPNASCDANETDVMALRAHLDVKDVELRSIQVQIEEVQRTVSRVNYQKFLLDYALSETTIDWADKLVPPEMMLEGRAVLANCSQKGIVVQKQVPLWKGYACDASDDDIFSFLEYEPNKLCPDDWFTTQSLIYTHHCYSLPKRRCMARTNQNWSEPLAFPTALFDSSALADENVRWSLHSCQSFHCLNTRVVGDCRNCFNLTLERNRWQRGFRGSLPIREVILLKKGALRLGLDAGGGTGTFAAHMALYNVTVLTSAMNIETVRGVTGGLPYMETMALRGLIPLWLPHKARLPFFDNTFDLVHCVNSIKYLPILEFEELVFEWDRVLRVGGVMWFEMFYAPLTEMPVYLAIIEQLGYSKLHWNITPKPDTGERKGMHVYLNCVIEKPVRADKPSLVRT